MATRIEHLLRVLRDLPYEDMVALSKALTNRLGDSRADAVFKLADALVAVRHDLIDVPQTLDAEERVLREMVGTRARGFDIKVRRLPKGWSASCDTFRAAGVQAPTARDTVVQFLDQAVGTYLMLK